MPYGLSLVENEAKRQSAELPDQNQGGLGKVAEQPKMKHGYEWHTDARACKTCLKISDWDFKNPIVT